MAGEHDCLEVKLTGITQRMRMCGKRAVPYWYVDIVDTGDGEAYRIGLAYASGAFMALAMNPSGPRVGRPLRIETYIKDGFTRLRVYGVSCRLSWGGMSTIDMGGKKVKDDAERMAFIEDPARIINERTKR